MTDIPVGSPPAPPGRHAAPGGWYPDPVSAGQERYWDGWQWSRNTRPSEVTQAPGVHPYPTYAAPPEPTPGPPAPGSGPYPGYPPAVSPPPVYPPAGYPAVGAPARQAAYTADGVPLASWGWRFLAVVLDAIAVNLLITLLTAPFGSVNREIEGWSTRLLEGLQSGNPVTPDQLMNGFPWGSFLLLTLLQLGVIVAYHVFFLRWKAATPGKLACRLRVVPVDQGRHPGPLSWTTIGVRVLLRFVVSPLIWLFALLDALWPLWQPKRQALHDLAAKTQVVRQPVR